MPPPDPAAMGPGEVASRSPLDKPFADLTDEGIAQLTREDCRRFLKAKGMRRPSWNKSQAIQQVISLKALFEGRPGCDDSPAGGGILRKPVTSAPVSPPQVVASLSQVLTRRSPFDLCLLLLLLPELAPSGDGGRQRRGRQWSATSGERALAVPEEGPVSPAILCRRHDLRDSYRRTRPSSPAGEPMLLPQVRLLARPKWSPHPHPQSQPPATVPLACAGFLIRRPGGVRPRTKWASCPICLHDGGRNLPCSLFSHTAFPMRATADLPGEQMTIFYDGMVNVYDDVSADQVSRRSRAPNRHRGP
ncbi:hypothetical protein GW17_00048902 [Ensete ventricosum]|nr:hypothetical protein GW17_00048902 [Ensete ventricosum]